MEYDLILKNALIKNHDTEYKAHLFVQGGKVARIDSTSGSIVESAKRIVDVDGLTVLPGMIDAHIHSREPGLTEKEDFYYATRAAAVGGITTVLDMPNSSPPVHNAEIFNEKAKLFESKAFVDFGLWGIALGNQNIDSLQEIISEGVVGIKFFWGYALEKDSYKLVYNYTKGMPDVIPPPDDGEVFQLFREMGKTNVPLGVHLENNSIISALISEMENKENDYKSFLEARPNITESVSIQTGILFAKETGAHLYVVHMTSKEGTEMVRQAQREGVNVTAETCPQYLFMTDEDYQQLGTMMKVYPPIRRKADQDALWQGVLDGTISTIGSDHAPHTLEQKMNDNIWEAPAGFAGVETIFPLMLHAVCNGKIPLARLVEVMSVNPAKVFGLYPRKGSIQVGCDADFTIVNLQGKTTIKNDNLHSKNPLTPFNGKELDGSVMMTIVRGNIVAENGKIVGEPSGKLIRRGDLIDN
jgi:allantoinase